MGGMSAAASFSLRTDTAAPPWPHAARALVTPCAAPLWRAFWPLLALALALRLAAAWHGHWFWRIDEVFQYLEQAHRVVFGYGHIPWEYRYDARTWLIPALVVPPLALAKWLGIDHPEVYASMVNSWNALLSMAIPACAYLAARRLLTETAARWTLVFTCLWFEFVVMAARTLSENYATLFFIAALAAGAGTGRWRWLGAGAALGMALAMRPHYAPLVAALGMLWLWQLPWRLSLFAVAGGCGALLLLGATDFLTLGRWWGSVFNYADYVPALFDQYWQGEYGSLAPTYFLFLAIASFGIYPAVLLLSLAAARRLWIILLLLLPVLALHTLHPAHEYSHILIALPLLWMAAGALIAALPGRRLARGAAALAAGVSIAGAFHLLPGMERIYRTVGFFSTAPWLEASYRAHEAIERKGNTVLVWATPPPFVLFGGFYALHRNIPVFSLPGAETGVVHDLQHHAIWQKSGVIALEDFATHVIAPPGRVLPSFDALPLNEYFTLYINRKAPSYPAGKEWVYDYLNPDFNEREAIGDRPLTPYNPDL